MVYKHLFHIRMHARIVDHHVSGPAAEQARHHVVLALLELVRKYRALAHADAHPAERGLRKRSNDLHGLAVCGLHLERLDRRPEILGLLAPRRALVHIFDDRLFVAHPAAAHVGSVRLPRVRANAERLVFGRGVETTGTCATISVKFKFKKEGKRAFLAAWLCVHPPASQSSCEDPLGRFAIGLD